MLKAACCSERWREPASSKVAVASNLLTVSTKPGKVTRELPVSDRVPTAEGVEKTHVPSRSWISFVVSVLFGSACAQLQEDTRHKLREFTDRVVQATSAAKTSSAPTMTMLTAEDLELLDAAKVATDRFTPDDLGQLVDMLRFAKTLRDEELPAVEEFGASVEGRTIRWPLVFVLVDRKRFDGAARLVVASALLRPQDERSFATWKWWETAYGTRDDYFRITRDVSLALLKRFENGTDVERRAIADVLGEKDLTMRDLPALRGRVEKSTKEAEVAWEETWAGIDRQESHKPAKVWIEDRRGLREIDRPALHRAQRSWERWEIRLAGRAGADAPRRDWGTLVVPRDDYGEEVPLLHQRLLEVAEAAGDMRGDLESRVGVIAVMSGHGEVSHPVTERIDAIAKALHGALSTWAGVFAAGKDTVPGTPSRAAERTVCAKTVLAAARAAAVRIAELTNEAGRNQAPEAKDDVAVLVPLEAAGSCLARSRLDSAAKDEGNGWRDMLFRDGPSKATPGEADGRTCVMVNGDRLTIVEFEFAAPSDTEAAHCGVTLARIRSEDLRDATIAPSDGLAVLVIAKRPIGRHRVDLPTGSRAAGIRRVELSKISIRCDTETHRQELIAELKRLAPGAGR